MTRFGELQEARQQNWRQVPERRVETPEAAIPFLNEVGIVTLYAASPEFPSLYQAHMGDPNPPTSQKWDSPSGYVYTWRWEIGRPHAAFYGVVVAKKPTWVSFALLPHVLAALTDRRSPQEAYAAGELSSNALAVAEAFEGTDGVLATKDLRARAGFEKGKESRAAYLKAVEELDTRLWLGKRFALDGDGDEMLHALVRSHYSEAYAAAMAMTQLEGLVGLLTHYLNYAVYLDPKVIGRHLRVDPVLFSAALEQMTREGIGRLESIEKTQLFVVSQ